MDSLRNLIKNLLVNEGLDRCVDDSTNMIEDMVADQTRSHQLIEARHEDKVEGDHKRARKHPEKEMQYQRSVRMNRRSQLHKRVIRKLSIIDDLLYSRHNLKMVKENLEQLDDVFKLLTEVQPVHYKFQSEKKQ